MYRDLVEKAKTLLSRLNREKRIGFLRSLVDIISTEGQKLSPRNFVWKILHRQCFDSPGLFCEEVDPTLLSPVFVASIIKHGQLLPAFVSPDGKIIDGRARYAILGDQLEYIILPGSFSKEMLISARTNSVDPDPLRRIADEEGQRRFLQKLGAVDIAPEACPPVFGGDDSLTGSLPDCRRQAGTNYHEEIRAAARSISGDLSLPEKTKIYVLLREMEFWKMVIAEGKRKISEIEERLNLRSTTPTCVP